MTRSDCAVRRSELELSKLFSVRTYQAAFILLHACNRLKKDKKLKLFIRIARHFWQCNSMGDVPPEYPQFVQLNFLSMIQGELDDQLAVSILQFNSFRQNDLGNLFQKVSLKSTLPVQKKIATVWTFIFKIKNIFTFSFESLFNNSFNSMNIKNINNLEDFSFAIRSTVQSVSILTESWRELPRILDNVTNIDLPDWLWNVKSFILQRYRLLQWQN